MSIRVSKEDVQNIMQDYGEAFPTDVSAYIQTANTYLEYRLEDVLTTVGETLLKEIERYLAAHFIAIDIPKPSARRDLDAEEEYPMRVGKGLEATVYGQQAIELDPTGLLKKSSTFVFEAMP